MSLIADQMNKDGFWAGAGVWVLSSAAAALAVLWRVIQWVNDKRMLFNDLRKRMETLEQRTATIQETISQLPTSGQILEIHQMLRAITANSSARDRAQARMEGLMDAIHDELKSHRKE